MDTRIKQQVSFIPKKPLVNKGYSLAPRKKKISLLNALGAVMMLCTALSFGGLYFWQTQAEAKTEQLRISLSKSREQIDDAAFTEYLKVDRQIKTAEKLLSTHTVSTDLFEIINSITVQRIQLLGFNFSVTPAGAPVVLVSGGSPSFGVLYRQVQTYMEHESIINTTIVSAELTEIGNVVFDIELTFEPVVGQYKTQFEEVTQEQQ
ncbi:MAG: hypothetical protein WDZ88_02620 [Candidatus Paceibacterota bacterium]